VLDHGYDPVKSSAKCNIDVYAVILVSRIQLICNGFNSQLVNARIKSTDSRTRGHNFKHIRQSCSVAATKYVAD